MAKQEKRAGGDLFEDEPRAVKGWVIAHCDGGSRGNPGPSGFGVLVEDTQGKVLAELSEFLGKRTNNYAEYAALLGALNFALDNGHPRLRVISDSELMVKQVKGQYRVNSTDLKPMHEEARHRIARLESFEIQHVLRAKNRKADELANLAMDRGTGRTAAAEVPWIVMPPDPPEPIPINRVGKSPARFSAAAAPAGQTAQEMRGFVKGGVVYLLHGATLPDGSFVKVIRED